MTILDFLKNNLLLLDGGMGTLLQAKGLEAGVLPETWNLTHPDEITAVHKAYYEAGCHVVSTNTFGANSLKFTKEDLEKIITSAVRNARKAQENVKKDTFVALDIGPTGKLLKPYGDLDFEDAVSVFSETVRIGVNAGVDLIFIETMNDLYETKAALLAAKENSNLPVFVSNAYGDDGKLITGADPEAVIALLEGMGADAIGVNCSFGPAQLSPIIDKYLQFASVPVLMKPNAGLPTTSNGKTSYDVSPFSFAETVSDCVRRGVRIAGGCCGTTPEYISALSDAVNGIKPVTIIDRHRAVISSSAHAVAFGTRSVRIGERINPTGKKKFREALLNHDTGYILEEAVRQQEKGVDVLDINVGIPDIDEVSVLKNTITEVQAVTDLPLQIDTSDPVAMEAALRRYNGKALINSVNGKDEVMRSVFPLVKKYGGMVVALTLDENGIPATAEGRVNIAEKILSVACQYGLTEKDILFDTLTMTVSADPEAANVTLSALKTLHRKGYLTTLGVSNVSFGLPDRDTVNASFYTMALHEGLDAAIMNPFSEPMNKAFYAFNALKGLDKNGIKYIENVAGTTDVSVDNDDLSLSQAIEKGLKDKAAELTRKELENAEPLDIIAKEIIPALNTVGEGYENKTVYLPHLLLSAEAAKSSFNVIAAVVPPAPADPHKRIVLATVKGDIHDIGKNIVRLLLDNYGFAVTDLGKDVSPETIRDSVLSLHAPLVGLSALMTTTVPAMEETIRLLRQDAPFCRIVCGGAVLTKEYAMRIGADKYASDAMETVRYALEILQ